MATTTYESPYPTGFMTPNIKAERRQGSTEVIRAARDHNIHDVEILRLQQVIGRETEGSGTIYERIDQLEDASGLPVHAIVGPAHSGLADGLGISPDLGGNTTLAGHVGDSAIHGQPHPYAGGKHTGNADAVPITADVAGNTTIGGHKDDGSIHSPPITGLEQVPVGSGSANHDFAKWFLGPDFMGVLTDWFGGNPNALELIKTIQQNKYDLEVLFDPKFLFTCDADGSNPWFEHTLTEDLEVWCGFTGQYPQKPIGAVCNLEKRPYAVGPGIEWPAGGTWYEGRQVIPSGQTIRLHTFDGAIPDANPPAEDYKAGLWGNEPYSFMVEPPIAPIPSGTNLATIQPSAPPEPPPPVGHDGPNPGNPGAISAPPAWADVPGSNWEPIGPEPVEPGGIILAPPLIGLRDTKGNVQIGEVGQQGVQPVPYGGNYAGGWVQLIPDTIWGVDLSVTAATFMCMAYPKTWMKFFATIALEATAGAPVTLNAWNFYLRKMFFNNGLPAIMPADTVFGPITDLGGLPYILNPGEYVVVPLGSAYFDEHTSIYGVIEQPFPPEPAKVIQVGWQIDGYNGF